MTMTRIRLLGTDLAGFGGASVANGCHKVFAYSALHAG